VAWHRQPEFESGAAGLGENVRKVGYAAGRRQDRLRIYGISPRVIFGGQPKLPTRVHMPGYFFTQPPEVPIPAEVVEFARRHKAEHRPVIGACFGSMVLNPAETTQMVVEAVRELNIAALLIGGWGELVADPDLWKPGSDICYVPQIDFASVLPELDGFITHAGSGSTAHILRAGIPFIGIIFVPDQFNWTLLGQKKGVSSKPMPRTELTKDALKAAILDMLTAPKREAARQVASQIELDGVRKAANLILSDLPCIPG
jgi:sterol 3beta-glucosyltransferase